jgi:MqsR (Motility quorum-sensing regulator) toxin of toxin-antitoxin system
LEPKSPLYSLKSIEGAARKGNVAPLIQASADIEELNFTLKEVCDAIMNIKPSEYWKSIDYTDKNTRKDISCDVYKTIFCRSKNEVHNLYIKLRLSTSGYVFLASFKPK